MRNVENAFNFAMSSLNLEQIDCLAMENITLDGVLDLEDEFYKKGFKDGQDQFAREQYLEGRAYGLQTGFQRFLIVGYIQGLIDEWTMLDKKNLAPHLSQLQELIDSIPKTNGDAEVEQYEHAITKARNKVRVVANITRTSDRIAKLDDLIKEVGGSLHVSENLDEMW